jgi:hypothetical protein
VYAGRVAPDRPLFLSGFRLPYNGARAYLLESITAEELVLVMPDGTRETWTRPGGLNGGRVAGTGLLPPSTAPSQGRFFAVSRSILSRALVNISAAASGRTSATPSLSLGVIAW